MFQNHQYRKTILKQVSLEGVGLHSGTDVRLTLKPAPVNTGIVFTHTRFSSSIKAGVESVVDTSLAVTLGNRDFRVQTVEHLMSAFSICGITDVICQLDGFEIPIMDGSAKPFLDALDEAGEIHYSETVNPLKVKNATWVIDDDKYIVVLPSDELKISYSIEFNHPMIKSQTLTIPMDADLFRKEIVDARTFGFLAQVEKLQSEGFALGGGEENAVIFTEDGSLNELRYQDECIRHKVLDLIGDLSLLGRPIQGHIIASKAGHTLDVAMAQKLLNIEAQNELVKGRAALRPAMALVN